MVLVRGAGDGACDCGGGGASAGSGDVSEPQVSVYVVTCKYVVNGVIKKIVFYQLLQILHQ